MTPLIKVFNQLLPRKPVVFPSLNDAASLPHEVNQDVVLMSTNNFHECLAKGYMHANNISVVILLTTLRTIARDHPTILTLSKEDAKPRIIGLVELDLHDIHNATDLKIQLDYLEEIYDLPIFMSKDVLAMNAFGEEIAVETVPYSPKNLSPIERNVWKLLYEISDFLQDMNIAEVSKSIQKVRAVVLWAVKVLTIFGLWSLNFMLEHIQNTLSGMLNKENNAFVALAIEACKTRFELVQKLVNSQSKAPIHSSLMYEIFEKLTPYQVLCNTTTAEQGVEIGEHEADVTSKQKPCVTDVQTEQSTKFEEDSLADKSSLYESEEETAHSETNSSLDQESMRNNESLNGPPVLEKRIQKLRNKSQFYCIIITRSNSFAKMLSKLINYMSTCNAKYSFMKSGCVIQSKNGSREEEERTESVLQAVLQGMVNIVVTTVDLFSDLSLTTFNVLVYFGTPSSYEEYYQIKHKIKGLAPKLMLVFNEDRSDEMKSNLQVFVHIESEIAKRVSDYITQENKEIWLRRLAEKHPCSYTPFGENGPSVSMESSIYLINRYCRRINRADFFNLYAEFITQRKDLTENCVEFVSKLYLPLSSYCSIVE
ncbi:endoribonuclease Dicer-like, partial [Paramuricea clavata]